MTSSITLAVDAMGGYRAPEAIVRAVADASQRDGDVPVYFTLVGDEIRLGEVLMQVGHNPERIQIRHAPTQVSLGEPAASVLEHKPDSSIGVACRLVADDDADAVITAGNPDAAVRMARETFELLPSVEQAALAAVYPTPGERGAEDDRLNMLLDVGANLRASATDLVDYALMGTAYTRVVSGIEHPRVALLSTSRERGVGPPAVVEAVDLLKEHPKINFYGNIEGHDIPRGTADVVVCEGMVGDITIKLLEGVAEAAFDLARAAYERKLLWKAGLRLLSGGLRRLKRLSDFEEYGGAPLLGTDHVMIVAHPRSGRKAIGNSLKLAIKSLKGNLPERIADGLREQSPSDAGDDDSHA